MDSVVHPAAGLLNTEATPLGLGQKAALGDALCDVPREDYMPAKFRSKVRTHGTRNASFASRDNRSTKRTLVILDRALDRIRGTGERESQGKSHEIGCRHLYS